MQDKIVQSVIDHLERRSEAGLVKYGVTLERDDLNFAQWLVHLQQELMDASLYIEKLKTELEESPAFPEGHIITKESWENADKVTLNGFIYVKFSDLSFYK